MRSKLDQIVKLGKKRLDLIDKARKRKLEKEVVGLREPDHRYPVRLSRMRGKMI